MPQRLAGRVVVVVGGTGGLGLSAAKAFVAEGARVLVVGHTVKHGREAETALGEGGRVLIADARDPQTAPLAIAAARRELGGFHGLYHVAGGSGRRMGDGPLHGLTDEGWRATLQLNLDSLCYSNRAAVRQFREQGTGGSVLNLGSVLAFSPSPRFFGTHAYAAAKAGIIGLTQAAAAAYARDNIRFNVLAPGLVATPMSQRAQTDPAIQAFSRAKQPLDGGRIGLPTDLDAAAVFFMSDDSKFVTGQVLAVDGGWSVTEGQEGAPAPSHT